MNGRLIFSLLKKAGPTDSTEDTRDVTGKSDGKDVGFIDETPDKGDCGRASGAGIARGREREGPTDTAPPKILEACGRVSKARVRHGPFVPISEHDP